MGLLGGGAIICPGVTIGDNGPANVAAAGNPRRVLWMAPPRG
jgi:hypothetical protein